MHILVTNDDGPPSQLSSPYILPFVRALEVAGHLVSVIIPSEQRSWIGKAHMIGQEVATRPYWPSKEDGPDSSDADGNRKEGEKDEEGKLPWILADSTPATCSQLRLSGFFFKERGKIDLVISGPNYGRNTTAVFALSSGTLGAALEASVCGYRAIALSFAFTERQQPYPVILEACTHAVRVCDALARQSDSEWADARLYSINVPVKEGVSKRRVVYTRVLQNFWRRGGCFREVSGRGGAVVEEPGKEEAKVRAGKNDETTGAGEEREKGEADGSDETTKRQFKWAPRFSDVFDSVELGGPGTDGWAVKEGETSVTALRANLMHVDGVEGVVKL